MNKIIFVLCLIFSLLIINGCTYEAPQEVVLNTTLTCVSSWSCSEWSTCINGTITRVCEDASNCNFNDSPSIKQSCNAMNTINTTHAVFKEEIKKGKFGENYMAKGDVIMISGRTINLTKVGDASVVLKVNDQMVILDMDNPRNINDLKFDLLATYDNEASIDIRIP